MLFFIAQNSHDVSKALRMLPHQTFEVIKNSCRKHSDKSGELVENCMFVDLANRRQAEEKYNGQPTLLLPNDVVSYWKTLFPDKSSAVRLLIDAWAQSFESDLNSSHIRTRGSLAMTEHSKCLAKHNILVNENKKVGVGATSVVYCTENCKQVVKIVDLQKKQRNGGSFDRNNFLKEVEMQKLASALAVSPKYSFHFICRHKNGREYGYLITDYWPETLTEKGLKNMKIYDNLQKILIVLREHNIVHNDLRAPNIVLKKDDETGDMRVALIDWGKSFRVSTLSQHEMTDLVSMSRDALNLRKSDVSDIDPYALDSAMLNKLFE